MQSSWGPALCSGADDVHPRRPLQEVMKVKPQLQWGPWAIGDAGSMGRPAMRTMDVEWLDTGLIAMNEAVLLQVAELEG